MARSYKEKVIKKNVLSSISFILSICSLLTGCQNASGGVWENTKTMGRYLQRKGKLLWSKDVDSRMIENSRDFPGPAEAEFIPLQEVDAKSQLVSLSVPQPVESPGMEGSSVPSIEYFSDPTNELARLFKTIYFNTDEHTIRTKDDYELINKIVHYLKNNPETYIFISGHCDERASEAYNLALGTRRANTIRNLLVKKGVNPEHVYTASFGKEMPIDLRHTQDAWAKNRRAEFKIFKKE